MELRNPVEIGAQPTPGPGFGVGLRPQHDRLMPRVRRRPSRGVEFGAMSHTLVRVCPPGSIEIVLEIVNACLQFCMLQGSLCGQGLVQRLGSGLGLRAKGFRGWLCGHDLAQGYG